MAFSLIWVRNNKFTLKNLLNRKHVIIQKFFKQIYYLKQSKSVFQLVKMKEKRLDLSGISHYYLLFSKIDFRINFKVNSEIKFFEDEILKPISLTGDLI